MKKLLGISVIAALAVLPMAGYAEPVTGTTGADAPLTTNNAPTYKGVAAGDNDGSLATAGYVKGAYNDAIKAVNKVHTTAQAAITDINTNKIGDMAGLTGDATTLVGAIEEVRAAADAASGDIAGDIGDLGDLTTTEKGTVVGAINELDSAIDTLNGSGAGSVDKKIEDNAAGATYNGTTSGLSAGTIQGAIDELASEKQEKSDSTVADGTYNYIQQGSGVAANLIRLDTAADANADAIAVLNGDANTNGSVAKQIATAVSNLNTTLGEDYATKDGVVATVETGVVTTAANTGTVSILATWGSDNATTANVSIPSLTGSIDVPAAGYVEPTPAP